MEKSDAFEILAQLDTIQNRIETIAINLHNVYVTLDGAKARVQDMASLEEVEVAAFYLQKVPVEKRKKLLDDMVKKG